MTPDRASLDDPGRLARLDQIRFGGSHDDRAAESLDRLTRLASRLLGAPVALVSLVDDLQQTFASQIGLAEPWSARGGTPLSHSFCQHVVTSGEALIVADAREHPLVRDNAAVHDLGVIAYAGMPLVVGRERVGSFCVIDSSPRAWADEELSVLRDLAGVVTTELELRWAIAERERAHEQMRSSERRFRALVEGMAEGVVLQDGDGAVIASNPAAERILGLTADQIADRASRDPRWGAVREDGTPFEDDDHPALETLRTGRPVRDVILGVHRGDGTLRWISIATELLPPERSGEGPLVLGTFTDVTERRAAEIALRADGVEHAALTRVATLVAADAAPSEVFAAVAEEAARVLDADAAGVVRTEPDGGASVVGAWSKEGLERPEVGEAVALDAPTAVARALREQRPARVNGYEGLRRAAGPPAPYRSGAAGPVHVRGRLWGAVTVATTGSAEFDDAATQRLERFANLVALAVSAAEAREKLVSLATSDELTGLPNQRAFRERLDREVRRAVRYGRPLSLVMLDIDHFKAINDTHGHPAGDRVLAAVARLLQGFVRGEELMARIGGEEFAWLLPEADVSRASLAAERAIELVSRDPLPGVGRVTVSAGVGELARAGSAADMVECADRALYAAKAGGRNRVAATPADGG